MPEFITTEAPTVPKFKPFKQQSMEERYRTLVERLQAKLDDWELLQDDLQVAAQVEEGNGNHGKGCGLRAKANAIGRCRSQLRPYIERHIKALA